jgi:hypothetical protein
MLLVDDECVVRGREHRKQLLAMRDREVCARVARRCAEHRAADAKRVPALEHREAEGDDLRQQRRLEHDLESEQKNSEQTKELSKQK